MHHLSDSGHARRRPTYLRGAAIASIAGTAAEGPAAPNFMVYVIATERGVKMPSVFGYMLWSGAVLLPVLAPITFVSVWRV